MGGSILRRNDVPDIIRMAFHTCEAPKSRSGPFIHCHDTLGTQQRHHGGDTPVVNQSSQHTLMGLPMFRQCSLLPCAHA